MGRLKIRNAFLHFREMRVAFLWEWGKKLNVRKRISNFRSDYPLFLQPGTVINTFAKDVKCYHSDLVRLPFMPWCESVQVSITKTTVLTFQALDFFLMCPFRGRRCNSQCQEDQSFTDDWEVLQDGELDSWGLHNTTFRGCLKYLQGKLLMNWKI